MKRYMAMALLLLLSACEGLAGAATAIGLQGLTVAGQGMVRNIERDIDAGIRWAGAHDSYVAVYMQSCMAKAGDIEQATASGEAYEACLETHIEHMPFILLERLELRRQRAKEGSE